jgi:hypothetical protein
MSGDSTAIINGIFNVASTILASNNDQQNRDAFARNIYNHGGHHGGYHNRGHHRPSTYNTVYNPPAVYTTPIIQAVIQDSYARDCWGKGGYEPMRHRDHGYHHNRNWRNLPCNIPNYGNYGSVIQNYPAPTYPVATNYSSVMATGNGQRNGVVEIAGRRIEISQNGTIDSLNRYGQKIRSFTVQGFGGFMRLGDDSNGKITFYPSSDRTQVDAIDMKYGNQIARVENISGKNGQGLVIPNSQDEYNPYQNNQNQGNVV